MRASPAATAASAPSGDIIAASIAFPALAAAAAMPFHDRADKLRAAILRPVAAVAPFTAAVSANAPPTTAEVAACWAAIEAAVPVSFARVVLATAAEATPSAAAYRATAAVRRFT